MYAAAMNADVAKVISLKRPLLIALAVGIAGLAVSIALGHPVMGILGVVGLGLGLFNSRMMQREALKAIETESSRKAITISSGKRLLLITAIAVALGVFIRPDGLGVFLGLAIFQIIVVVNTVVPVLKGRQQQ